MMATIFALANFFVLPFWLLMIVLPHWRWTRRIMDSLWPVVILALAYAALVIPILPAVFGSLLNPTLGGIMTLLGSEAGATIGWIHFLAFDLFVGRWAYLDSRERGLPAWLGSPTLFFILMLGPLGLLLYLAARWAWTYSHKS
jgi:hypothetical protein